MQSEAITYLAPWQRVIDQCSLLNNVLIVKLLTRKANCFQDICAVSGGLLKIDKERTHIL